jgi:hypothetical protein
MHFHPMPALAGGRQDITNAIMAPTDMSAGAGVPNGKISQRAGTDRVQPAMHRRTLILHARGANGLLNRLLASFCRELAKADLGVGSNSRQDIQESCLPSRRQWE